MLLAVEGGGFFSSSALGYSKGLALLLLGQRADEKHMRVAPWNQYQLVDRETDGDLQLASGKNRSSRGCASFVCFGRASAGHDGQSPLKVGPTQLQDILPNGPAIERDKELSTTVERDNNARSISLTSSLKKSSRKALHTVEKSDEQEPLAGEETNRPRLNISLKSSLKKSSRNTLQTVEKSDEREPLAGEETDRSGFTGRRKVQWTDTYGKDLAEIREFELSETGGSDDEFINGDGKTCSCRIM